MVLELVESAAIRNPERALETLRQLRGHGIRIALDDFGTGFSNLERLQQFEVDIVKIDRRFLRGLGRGQGDRGILRALHALSQDMGFTVIAEGVETEATLRALQEIGIYNAQGYLLGRPEKVGHWQSRITRPLAPGSASGPPRKRGRAPPGQAGSLADAGAPWAGPRPPGPAAAACRQAPCGWPAAPSAGC